jgi:hypothetical protein
MPGQTTDITIARWRSPESGRRRDYQQDSLDTIWQIGIGEDVPGQ